MHKLAAEGRVNNPALSYYVIVPKKHFLQKPGSRGRADVSGF
jgi:hypothetical protein